MVMATSFATQTTTTNGSTATKGFLSFSSQSILESGKGPSIMDRLRANSTALSINMQRYKLSSAFANVAAVIRLLQCYCVMFMPSYSDFWLQTQESQVFVTILKIPTHLCFFSATPLYHTIIVVIFFLFFLFSMSWGFWCITGDAESHSHSNAVILGVRLLNELFVPIVTCFVFSAFGYLLGQPVFHGNTDAVVIIGVVFGGLGVIMAIFSHFWSFYVIRGRATIDFSRLFVPWGPKVRAYAILDMGFYLLAFIEEFLPMNKKWYRIGYTIGVCLLMNPITATVVIRIPLFQDSHDTIYYSTLLVVGFVATIMINLTYSSAVLTPAMVFVVSIIIFVVVQLAYKQIKSTAMAKLLKQLYSVYRNSKPVLPHVTPLVFTSPLSNQVALSQEAYQTMQAFNSLELKRATDFHRMLAIGAQVRMPAVANIDFIKWGLNYFTDYATLVMCAQICQHFGENNQTQTVLLQKIRENSHLNMNLQQIVMSLEYNHTDAISDKPLFLKALEKKAQGGLTRCRRTVALFWGCILNHSVAGMRDALCRIRDAVNETNDHFDELIRCYPTSLSAISLYLSYLTEIKGEYIECNQYINEMSATFIELKSDQVEDDESMDGMSVLLSDPNKSFAPYIKSLGSYMEQQRHVVPQARTPIRVLVSLTVVSLVVILGSLIYVIVQTLIELNDYPRLLKVVSTFADSIINIAELTMATRRMCLFAAGKITEGTAYADDDVQSSVLAYPESTLRYMLQGASRIDENLKSFYSATATSSRLVEVLHGAEFPMVIYGRSVNATLAFGLDSSALNLQELIANVPRFFKDEEYDIPGFAQVLEATNPEHETSTSSAFAERLREKTAQSLRNARFSYLSLEHMHNHTMKNEVLSDEATVTAGPDDYDLSGVNFQDYTATCSSSEMKNVIRNIAPLAQLVTNFMGEFYAETDDHVEYLDTVLYWSMIIFPVAFIVIFGISLISSAVYIVHERDFRMTLYLSLPEQVASEIFRSGGGAARKKTRAVDRESALCEVGQEGNSKDPVGPTPVSIQDNDALKEKALTIETLHQFASTGNGIHGSGLSVYVSWMCVYIVIAAVAIFGLAYYAKTVNSTFSSRSMAIAYSAMRYLLFEYTTILTQELFYYNADVAPLKMNFSNFLVAYGTAKFFWDTGKQLNEALTYGSGNISFDFREYEGIAELYLKTSKQPVIDYDNYVPISSVTGMVHDGYRSLGLDSRIEIFFTISKAIMDVFVNAYVAMNGYIYFAVDDDTWKAFNHLLIVHLSEDLQNASQIYNDAVSEVIDSSFTIALVISIGALIVLIIIFAGPILLAVTAIRGYTRMSMQILCQVPPDVFSRSMYIHKWLKGQITRRNYQQKANETYYKRTVSARLQNKVVAESPEKMLLFNSQGQFVEGYSIVPEDLEDPNLETVLGYIIDVQANKPAVEQIQRAMERFMEAKDTKENVAIHVMSNTNAPMKLTVTGISSADASMSSTSSIQRFYAYVAILVRDITQEASEEAQYETQKQYTLKLLSCVVPPAFAQRMHDGERRISFSAGIGSVLTAVVVDYDDKFAQADPASLSAAIADIRSAIDNLLLQFTNLSLISMKDGIIVFVAGLFNDEQNGRTEAIDTIQFAGQVHKSLTEVLAKYSVDLEMQYGMCTGGPIYCKLLMDATPVILVSGETCSASQVMVTKCNPQNLVLERTTYECIYGLNIEAQMAGETEIGGKKVTYYTVPVSQIVQNQG